jgi:hypothetical protein
LSYQVLGAEGTRVSNQRISAEWSAPELSRFLPLFEEDVRVLDALCVNEERFEADTDIVRQGDVPRSAFVLTHGMAFRYRLMPSCPTANGRF